MVVKRKKIQLGPLILVGAPTLYMILLFVAPIFVFFIYSFWYLKGWEIIREWTLKNYIDVVTNPSYLILITRSIIIGLTTACVTVILSYPVAYAMAFRMKEGRELILLLMVLSLFSSYLVRVYAWKTILGNTGVINTVLLGLGLVQEPVSWLIYSNFAVIVTLVSVFFPITILPIYSALMNIQPGLLEAARDLGAGAALAFYKITLPLSLPGVVAGFVFTFILTAGDYVTPSLLGGSNGQLIGNSIVSQFGTLSNWPLGSAITFFVIGIFLVLFAAGGLLTRRLGLRG
jgi:spermidine/putrescine transport system permease protein